MTNRTIIIAEAGVNHNGNIELAKRLIDEAAHAGADYVKFQTFNTDLLVSKSAKKAEYQIKNTKTIEETQYEMVKKLELSVEDHNILIAHCKNKGIKFLSTAFDFKSIALLEPYQLDFFKIPSGEITNLPYLEAVGKLGKKIILSTGMATMDEVKEALGILIKSGASRDNITILHCTTEYPAPFNSINLNAMLTMRDELQTDVGYSDHSEGIAIPIAAVALGAKIIEKHFTVDKTLPGPDHKASLNPEELVLMIKYIRETELALGSGIKAPNQVEIKNINIARKSIHSNKTIKKGEKFSIDNITSKRPGNGISPMKWKELLGKKANRNYNNDELIDPEALLSGE